MFVLAVVSLLFPFSECTSECPSNLLNGYCSCSYVAHKVTFQCSIDNVTKLMHLSDRYRQDVESLFITLIGITVIPSSALIYDNLKTLSITARDVIAVNTDAFVGLEKSLVMLTLIYTRLEDIPSSAISRLKKLRQLYMQRNQLSSLNTPLHNKALTHLVLSHNDISEIGRDVLPESLEYLELANNRLSSLGEALKGNLLRLVISNNNIRSLDGAFNNVPGIQQILADHNKIENIDECFRGLRYLAKLNLAHNHIHQINNGFSGLSLLNYLDLRYNGLTNLVVETSIDHKNLQIIYLSHNNITHLDERLFYCMKDLRLLDISFTSINSLEFIISSKAINRKSEKNRARDSRGCNYIIMTDRERLGCSFRDNPRLVYLVITGSGIICDRQVIKAFDYLHSRGTFIDGNPCKTDYEDDGEPF